MKHTPAPWEHNDYQIIAGETVIANCTYGARNSNNANDARLIAAAPELLAALLRLLNDGDVRDAAEKGALTQARAAIAKATGEQA